MMMMKVCVWMMVIVMMVGSRRVLKVALADENYEKQQVMHVVGNVKCQDCSGTWSQWNQGARPLKGCKVSITCMGERKRVINYGSDTTDEDGEYDILVDKMVHGKKVDPKDCVVRLVSSPDPTCNVPTDFAHGKTGVNLRQPSVVYRDLVKYFLGTFYYTTSECDDPHPDNSNQGSYSSLPSN